MVPSLSKCGSQLSNSEMRVGVTMEGLDQVPPVGVDAASSYACLRDVSPDVDNRMAVVFAFGQILWRTGLSARSVAAASSWCRDLIGSKGSGHSRDVKFEF